MATMVPAHYNTEYIFYVSLVSQADTKLIQNAPTLASGDVLVSTDGNATTNLDTLPVVTPGSSDMVKVTVSADEMNGDNIMIVFSDVTGSEWCDLSINIQTAGQTLDFTDQVVDSIKTKLDNATDGLTALKAILDTSGVKLTAGSVDAIWDELITGSAHNTATSAGRRLRTAGHDEDIMRENTCQAGEDSTHVKLDTGASASNNYYDHATIYITGGTGVGQARVIDEYVGSTKVGEVHPDWLVNPAGDSTYMIIVGVQVFTHDIGQEGLDSIQAALEEDGASLLDTLRDELANGTDGLTALKSAISAIPTTVMRGTDNVVLAGPTKAQMDTAHALLATSGNLGTLLTRLSDARAGYLDQLDFNLQEAISTVQADLDNPSQYKADLSTLETRLSAVRAGYLDQLDFAVQEAIAAIPTAAMRGTDNVVLSGPTKAQMDTAHALLATPAQVNSEVVDALGTDTLSELSVGVPSATPTMKAALMLLYMALRNQTDITNTAKEVHNNAGTVIAKKVLSDDNTTYSETKMVSG